MLENDAPRLRDENRICAVNLVLTLALTATSGIISFLDTEPGTGWLMLGCGAALSAAYVFIGRLGAGITPKALLSALCQPPMLYFLLGFGADDSPLLWLALIGNIALTGVYFRIWVSLPQFALTDIFLIIMRLWQPSGSIVPLLAFQAAGAAVLLTVWRGNLSWKKYRYLAGELDSFLDLFGDLYVRLQQGFDRTLVRLEQIREQDELLSECSASLCSKSEPVLSGIQRAAELVEQIPPATAKTMPQHAYVCIQEARKKMLSTQSALEQNQKTVEQVVGIVRTYQGDLRAIQMDAKSLESLTKQLYGLLCMQKEIIQPTS